MNVSFLLYSVFDEVFYGVCYREQQKVRSIFEKYLLGVGGEVFQISSNSFCHIFDLAFVYLDVHVATHLPILLQRCILRLV